MDVDKLKAFQRVLREGSFTRAARSLGIGQPAASARIHALEGEVGGALFTRGRGIALTPLGESFHTRSPALGSRLTRRVGLPLRQPRRRSSPEAD